MNTYEKFIERLEKEEEFYNSASDIDQATRNGVKISKEIVNQVASEYGGGWIPCSERLPEVANNLDDADCPEFNVTIDGASETTTLKCDAAGNWFDENMNFYQVIAWQPLPPVYKPESEE